MLVPRPLELSYFMAVVPLEQRASAQSARLSVAKAVAPRATRADSAVLVSVT
jgi:hypothetical protein